MYLSLHTKPFVKEDFAKFFRDLFEVHVAGILFCDDNNIMSRGQILPVQSEEFPDEPFDSVPFHRIPCPSTNSNPQSRNAQSVLFENDSKMSCVMPFTRPI